MAAFDDIKTEQKQSTVFIQVAADTLYQTRRNTFFKVLLSSMIKRQIADLTLILTTENNTSELFK